MIPLLVVLGCAGAVAFALWIYGRREPAVRGRWVLAGLRAAALVLLVLLLWNPLLPLGGSPASPAVPRVLLDASLSMEAAGGGAASSAWERAVERAEDEGGHGARILLFGEAVRAAPADSLRLLTPSDRESRLAPAVERAAELGAARVRVLTDRRLADPADLARTVARTGIELAFGEGDPPVRNAGIGELVVPLRVAAGDSVTVELLLHGQGGAAGDSVSLSLEVEGSASLTRRVPLPGGNRPVRHRLSSPVAGEQGIRRLVVEARLTGDAFPRDDRRAAYLEVGAGTGRLLLVSLDPDWEPRYLLPVLEQVTGLESRGFLRVGEDRWLPMGRREERTSPRSTSEVRSAASGAELLVVHGVDGGAPSWVRGALETAPRALLLPRDPGGAALAGVRAAGPLPGEWYAVPDLPASPLAGELSGVAFDDLPPLTGVLPVSSAGGGAAAPLHLRRGGRGPVEAALVLRTEGGGRTAVTLASGFWRWAAREGPAREAYRRLWGGVAGWLLAGRPERTDVAVEPTERIQPEGRAVGWRVRGVEGDSLRLEIRGGGEGEPPVLDTVLDLRSGGPIRTPPLPPGTYAYRAGGGDPGLDARGILEITGYSDDLLRPLLDPGDLAGDGAEEGRRRRSGGTPLRALAAPYLLLLGLLCAEWIGRRRTGLR